MQIPTLIFGDDLHNTARQVGKRFNKLSQILSKTRPGREDDGEKGGDLQNFSCHRNHKFHLGGRFLKTISTFDNAEEYTYLT